MSVVTKKALAASLKTLMENQPLEKITVIDLANDCGVSGQIFYYHFQDINDLLGWIYRTEAVDGIAACRTSEAWPKGFLMIFEYVAANWEFCKSTFHSIGRDHLERFLHEVTHDLMAGVIDELDPEKTISEKDKDFIANFYTYAFVGLLAAWIRDDMRDDPAIVIESLRKLMEGEIPRVVLKYSVK